MIFPAYIYTRDSQGGNFLEQDFVLSMMWNPNFTINKKYFKLKTTTTTTLTTLNCMISFSIMTRNFIQSNKIEYFSKMSKLLFYLFKCLKFIWLYFCKSCTIKNPMKNFICL